MTLASSDARGERAAPAAALTFEGVFAVVVVEFFHLRLFVLVRGARRVVK